MKEITLENVIPYIFLTDSSLQSNVWKQEVVFEKGNSYLIQANSGTGKSSLCSYLYGYRDDFSGTILFDNINIKNQKSAFWDKIRCKHLSLLFQELCLFPELTAYENVLLKNNLTHHKTSDEIDFLFEKLGVFGKKNSLVGKMSWGQQQRIALIRSLCQPFDFILLDEPISHLDDQNTLIMAEMIVEEAFDQQAGVIVTSVGKHLPIDYSKIFML